MFTYITQFICIIVLVITHLMYDVYNIYVCVFVYSFPTEDDESSLTATIVWPTTSLKHEEIPKTLREQKAVSWTPT